MDHRPHDLIKVEAPPGAHDDAFTATTRALWLAHAAQSNNFVLAGQKLNLNLGSGIERGTDFAVSAKDEKTYRKLQLMKHQAATGLRHPANLSTRQKIMSQGLRGR